MHGGICDYCTGCADAGMTSCCLSDACQVTTPSGSCFCDSTCYATRDCCNDIEFTCPFPGTKIIANTVKLVLKTTCIQG